LKAWDLLIVEQVLYFPGALNVKKILIIEDDWNFQALLSIFLCENGFEVESADNGQAGLKKALRSRPDLILMDYNLGDMDGHDAAFWLEYMKGTRRIPVILLSAMGGDPAMVAAFRKYPLCRGVLCKTMPLERILKDIQSALR